jgi:hypothetical protein
VQLRFDPGDDDYSKHREAIRLDFESWLTSRPDLPHEYGDDVELLLDWRVGYSTGDLARFTLPDLEEFLLEWCPRKLSFPPEDWLPVLLSVQTWLQYLDGTGQWAGGRFPPVLAGLADLTPRYLDAMADPAKFGMAKSLFAGPALAGADLDLDDPASLQAAMDRFNALSFEERKALTDPGLAVMSAAPTVDLPMTPAVDLARAAAEAEAAPILVQLRAAVDYLGAGRPLTSKGNPKVADARALRDLFGTDDVTDYAIGDHEHKVRSADNLPHLMYLVDTAVEAGALRRHGGKMVGVKSFAQRDALEQVRAVFDAMVEMGAIFGRWARYDLDEAALMEDGLVHWMVPVFVTGATEVDDIVEFAVDVVSTEFPSLDWRGEPRDQRDEITRRVEMLLDVVERCGLVIRRGERREPDDYGRVKRRGGTLTLTELGRALMPPWLATGGYQTHDAADLADIDTSALLEVLASAPTLDPLDAWALWAPDRTPDDKAAAVVAAMQVANSPNQRVEGFGLIRAAGPAGEIAVRALLGTPLAGYAGMLLVDVESEFLADAAAIEPALTYGPLVDSLAVALDGDMDEVIELFDEMAHNAPLEVLAELWRVEFTETIEVLEAIGRRHPDKVVAKAARKGVIQHRTRFPR